MAYKNKKVKSSLDDDNTIIYMVVGFCIGVILTIILFEYYWIGVGGGIGMLFGVFASIVVDYLKVKDNKKVKKVTRKKK